MENSIKTKLQEIEQLKIQLFNANVSLSNSLAYMEETSKKHADSITQMNERTLKYFEINNALNSAKEELKKECIDIINQF